MSLLSVFYFKMCRILTNIGRLVMVRIHVLFKKLQTVAFYGRYQVRKDGPR